MSILVKGRSPLGAFVRSTIGVKGLLNNINHSDGFATVFGSNQPVTTLDSIGSEGREQDDKPYGTQKAVFYYGSSDIPFGLIGKIALPIGSVRDIERFRFGISYSIPALAGRTVHSAYYIHTFASLDQTLEPLSAPILYMSNTDDSGYDGTGSSNWWTHLDNLVGSFIIANGRQLVQIPNAFINTKAGLNMSLVIGTTNEFTLAGIAGPISGGIEKNSTINCTNGGNNQIIIQYV